MIDVAARLAVLPTLPDLDPSSAEEAQRAIARSDVIADSEANLVMLDWNLRHDLSLALATKVFPKTTPATAERLIRAHLDQSRLLAFTPEVRTAIATAFARAWYPQTGRA